MPDDLFIVGRDQRQRQRSGPAKLLDDLRLSSVTMLGKLKGALDYCGDRSLVTWLFRSNLHAPLIALAARQC